MGYDGPDSSETCRLLESVIAGDAAAFERLFERHRPAIRRAVQRRLGPMVRPRADPSDVVQETQLEALRRLDDFLSRRPMPFGLWLLKTAHERLLKIERRHLEAAKRSARREVPLPDSSSLHLGQLIARGPTPSVQLERRELAQRVRALLAQLTEPDREIIFLRNFDGLSNKEAACLLELSPEAAKKRYARALLRLETLMGQSGLTESEL